jgi:aminoglycoside phosphotransferase (APT) family kinase protein
MALLNELDAAAAEAALRDWLGDRLSGAADVQVTDLEIPHSAGMSMTTVLFTATWTKDGAEQAQRLVARVSPTGPGVFKRPDLVREFRLLQKLSGTPVPVPTPCWVEEDAAVLGAPFMVVQRVDGRVPGDDPPYTVEGWVMDLPPADRGKLFDGMLEQIAQIHALDWQRLGLGEVLDEPEFGPPGIAQQLRHWEDTYEWAAADGIRSPTVDAALVWARDNCPPEEELVLNWGDARIGNIIFGDDLSVAAVLDWEMALIGSPEVDVGWTALIMRYMTEGVGAPHPAGMPDRTQMIDRYQELTGREVHHVNFYEAFSALKLSILYLRVGSLMIAGGKLPSDSAIAVNNPCSQMLARLTGLPAPAGQTVNYVGHR